MPHPNWNLGSIPGGRICYKMIKEEKYMVKTKQQIGKASRAAGQRFELKVREDLEKKGWIVDKWSNNVEFYNDEDVHDLPFTKGRLVKVKNKFLGPGRPMMLGAGFPDFIAFRTKYILRDVSGINPKNNEIYYVQECSLGKKYWIKELISVESKMRGILDKQEKQKCKWLLDNNIFSKILIAQKGEKRGEIIYKEFK